MQGAFVVHVEFLDANRAPEDVSIPVNYQPGSETKMCMQILATINMCGGVQLVEDGSVTLWPLATTKYIRVSAPVLSTATPGDIAAALGSAGKIVLS